MILKDKTFYESFFSILIVITLQQLASLAVNMVDNIMLGTYSEAALSGATLVNQYQMMLQMLAGGAGMGIVVLAGQYWGKQQTSPIKKIISLGIKVALAVGLIFLIFAILTPTGMLKVFTSDEAIISEGVKYLNIMFITYPIFALSSSLMSSLQAVGTVFIGTVMSLSTVAINFVLNSILIYGRFGAPELGVQGAAIATVVSRTVELVIIFVYVLKIDKKLQMKFSDIISMDMSYLKDYIHVAFPLLISGFFWGIAQAVQTVILGHLTAPAIAANSICSIAFGVLTVVGMACTSATNVVMSEEIGRNGLTRIKSMAITLQIIYIIIGVISGLLTFLLRGPIVGIYSDTLSPEAQTLTWQFLTVLIFTNIGSCYEYPVASGIIAGGGDTKFPAIVENLFNWLWVLPGSALCAFVFKLPPIWVFIMLKSDQVLKCIPNAIKCNRFKWARELTREEKQES